MTGFGALFVTMDSRTRVQRPFVTSSATPMQCSSKCAQPMVLMEAAEPTSRGRAQSGSTTSYVQDTNESLEDAGTKAGATIDAIISKMWEFAVLERKETWK